MGQVAEPEAVTMGDRVKEVHEKLNLTDQEKFLYQMHLDNLYGSGGVNHDNGSRSTLYQAVQENEGKFYNVPTVWGGKIETEPYTRGDGKVFDVPNKTALENIAKTGWDQFPSYASPTEADTRYDAMHQFMEEDTQNYFTGK